MPDLLRSWMFVPGNKQHFLDKAAASATDVVLFDLEDGVIPASKPKAREMIAATLARTPWEGPRRYVRVNAATSPWFDDDLGTILVPGLDGLCLPKAEDAATVVEVAGMLRHYETSAGIAVGTIRIIAAIESAASLSVVGSIAGSHPRVQGIIFGAEDYALDVGLGTRRDAEAAELVYARSAVVVAAAAANVLSIDGVFPDLDDPDGLVRDVRSARRLGFGAKSTFNPRQVDVINDIFSPQPDELDYARRVVEAFEVAEAAGDASVAVGGQLVDLPIVRRAQRMLESVGER